MKLTEKTARVDKIANVVEPIISMIENDKVPLFNNLFFQVLKYDRLGDYAESICTDMFEQTKTYSIDNALMYTRLHTEIRIHKYVMTSSLSTDYDVAFKQLLNRLTRVFKKELICITIE